MLFFGLGVFYRVRFSHEFQRNATTSVMVILGVRFAIQTPLCELTHDSLYYVVPFKIFRYQHIISLLCGHIALSTINSTSNGQFCYGAGFVVL